MKSETTRELPIWATLFACVMLAAFIGWLDFHASEVQPAVALLLASSAVLAWFAPKQAWLVALLLGLSIIETHFVARAMGLTPPSATAGPTLIALIPSSIGAAAGAVARRISRPVTPGGPN